LTQNINGKQFGRTYHFDKIFAPDTTQERLYDSAISPIVDEVLQGFNCTIFAYGQTGTGKTHTMTGDINDASSIAQGAGVIPRAVGQIFNYLESIGGATEYTVKCCFLELYNEEITDLLATGNPSDPKVRILEDRSGVVMQGLEEPHVKTAGDIFTLLGTGNARRRTAETLLNKQSSRSHSVFIVTVSVREVLAEGEEVIRVGKLYLVDLAGSENVSRSGAVDQRAKEAGNINKSLLTLGRVITALVEGQGHVPYRDSKLTRLLRDSLGGKTKTCIIATIAPTVQCQEETLSTLDYAHRAKNIKNKPEVNQKISKTTHLKEFAVEIARLKAELVATRNKNGVFLPPEQYEEECEERRLLAARVEELEEETSTANARHEEEKAALIAEWEGRVAEVRGELEETRDKLESTRAELEAAKVAIAERNYMLEAHRKAENALAGHAGSLNSDLAAAAADVGQLFRRVDAKNDLEDANLKVVKGLKKTAVERLSALEAAVGAAAGEQAERFATAEAVLEDLATRKAVAGKALESHMGSLKERVAGLSSAAEAAATALATAAGASLDTLGEEHAEFFKIAQTAAAEASSALEEAYTILTNSTQEEKAALEMLLTGQTAATEAVRSATETIVAAVQESLEAAQEQAEAAKAAVVESFSAQAAAADAMQADFATAARKEQEDLLTQLSSLIAGFVDRAEGQMQTVAAEMKSSLAFDQKKLKKQMTNLSAAAGTTLADLATNAAAAETAQATAATELASQVEKLNSTLEASMSYAADVESVARDHAAAAASALAKHGKTIAATVKKESKALTSAADKQAKIVESAATDVDAAREEAQVALEADLVADTEAVATLQTTVADGTGAMATFASTQNAGLTDLSTAVTTAVDEKYAKDVARDDIPAVRQRTVPSLKQIDALRAPAEEILLRQFRDNNGMGDLECSADMMEDKLVAEEAQEHVVDAAAEEEEAEEEENVAPLDAVAAEVPAAAEPSNILSPSLAGQKRSRAADDDGTATGEASPSKLRAAFVRGQQRRRRTTRHSGAVAE
jgi:kinesin family protein 11